MDPLFTEHHLQVVRFCAIECELQVSGERSVYHMLRAWAYAQDQTNSGSEKPVPPTTEDVTMLGRIIEPEVNRKGYREHNVRVGWDVKMPWRNVSYAMERLVAAAPDADPAGWYRAFEEIHPFGDGNGRTGQVLYNWLCGSLMAPEWAPNFWEDPRRSAGEGA